jgi:hypothetical protein
MSYKTHELLALRVHMGSPPVFDGVCVANLFSFLRPELIPDIEQFLPITIFKMAATIPQKLNIVRYHHNMICG